MRRNSRRFSIPLVFLVTVVGLVFLGLGAVLIAQAGGSISTAQQVPPWKIQPGTFGPRPAFTPWPAPTPQSCAAPVDPLPKAGLTNPDAQGPLSSSKYPVVDSWAGQVGADYIQAWGGGISTNADGTPNTAALWLYAYTETANHCGFDLKPLGQFVLSHYRSLTITSVNGTIMALTTDTGSKVTFDLMARSFQ